MLNYLIHHSSRQLSCKLWKTKVRCKERGREEWAEKELKKIGLALD